MRTLRRSQCTLERKPKSSTLGGLVADSLRGQSKCARGELEGYSNRPTENALVMAARADDGYGNTHDHQWNLWSTTAKHAEEILLKNIDAIVASTDFDSLHSLIKTMLNIPGAGEMYWYDTAFRIGINLGLYPQKVYLHRGTRIGAKNLGLDFRKDVLEMSELPAELQELEPYQVEDFLCLYKDALKTSHKADALQGS